MDFAPVVPRSIVDACLPAFLLTRIGLREPAESIAFQKTCLFAAGHDPGEVVSSTLEAEPAHIFADNYRMAARGITLLLRISCSQLGSVIELFLCGQAPNFRAVEHPQERLSAIAAPEMMDWS